MPKTYQIRVFGKSGCEKCAVLNQRIEKILADKQWQDFEKQYYDMDTEEGLIMFSEAECINPHRIPALLIARWNQTAQEYEPEPARLSETPEVPARSRLCQYLGVQTDYGDEGRGVITPNMIRAALAEARR